MQLLLNICSLKIKFEQRILKLFLYNKFFIYYNDPFSVRKMNTESLNYYLKIISYYLKFNKKFKFLVLQSI